MSREGERIVPRMSRAHRESIEDADAADAADTSKAKQNTSPRIKAFSRCRVLVGSLLGSVQVNRRRRKQGDARLFSVNLKIDLP